MEDLITPLPKQMQSEMMDDVRPLSLPSNDCAASKARRIEGRPGTGLRPSSERQGRVTLKRGTLAIASKVVSSSEDPFRNLSDHILEHILARLPRFLLKAAKKVCKRWASVTSTPEFDILHNKLNPKPRLVRYEFSTRGSSDTQCLAYDVENNAWVTLLGLQLPAHNHDTLTGASGLVFFVAGPGEDRLLYKLTSSASSAESFGETWYETPVMTFYRYLPVVSVALGAGRGHKVVVAGGGALNHRAVEVFDSEIGTWESYGDLPEELSLFNNLTSMSGIVCDNKLYVSLSSVKDKIGSLQIHFLDLFTKQWASIQLKCPKDLTFSRLLAIGTTLVVAGVCTRKRFAVKLWKVDLSSLSLIQIGLMPRKLVALPKDQRSLLPLTFYSDENLVYFGLNHQPVLAEVSLEECKTSWGLLPAVPDRNPNLSVDTCFTFFASISSA